MSLKDARRIANREKKSGKRVEIRNDRAACKERFPDLHPMAGGYVVEVTDPTTGDRQLVWQ